ncbi:hypothetical protein [Bradyrhizobium iriomotense]|uniref:DUF1835 domain-containing protein n=1 Tax=Bradyrhizobium iriomotense TaxID=441950 RepID=A0ABQ6BA82_9BRAD|nr:hypothetical protein [Bradyrhizobium iriomotense]GLR90746.1 hypothetical protein GCM10007857_74610 [Bradyrhizobium iriomotense]
MARLIVTTDSSTAGAIQYAGLADLVIAIERRLVWGPMLSAAELDAFFAPRTTQLPGLHWLDDTPDWRLEEWGVKDRGFIELFAACDSFEFWQGPEPNAQLILLWLLDHWRRGSAASSSFMVRHLYMDIGDIDPRELAKPYPFVDEMRPYTFKLAGRAWRAYCAPSPQSWQNLFKLNLVGLPQLSHCVHALLEELPGPASGLGATEKQILTLVARGDAQPFDCFPGYRKRNERRVYGYWEVGALLDGLARCGRPAVSGLDEGPFP